MPRVYLDSCIVVYLIQGPESVSHNLRERLQSAERVPCVSNLTRLECRVWPIRHNHDELLAQFDGFFEIAGVERLPIHSEVFDLATELRARHGTKTPDALHLATAILGGCDEFWTNDHRLNAAAEGRIVLSVLPEADDTAEGKISPGP